MKKLYIFVLIIILAVVAKLSYDVYKISAQQTELKQVINKLEKSGSNLNDQLVAIKRDPSEAQTVTDIKKITDTQSDIQPNDMIKQQLSLVEFALKQHQYHYAVEKLIELDHQIDDYVLAPSLKNSLHQVIDKDIQTIKQYVVNSDAQQQKINQLILQLNSELKQEIINPNLAVSSSENAYFWQKWFLVESTKKPNQQLMQRSVVLKEAQLRLLIAREALSQGQFLQYHKELADIIQLVNQLPDQVAKQLVRQIKNIDGMTAIPVPVLSTRALLG
ncbi:hypothetical protein [Acinetobacter portensis]|uniref:hypothetical protein n=1 Tax=Acinetobacter portensis TaxID=1839785 RepID=UPI0013CF679E|nr:hypothetical protein [Acinetobacter portensis]